MTVKTLHTFTNPIDNLTSEVRQGAKGFAVVLRDNDAEEYLPWVQLFRADQEQDAVEYAKLMVKP